MEENCEASARESSGKNTGAALRRFFSLESSEKVERICSDYEWNPSAEYKYGFCSVDFFLKLSELILGTICTGLYLETLRVLQMENRITYTMMFPNVVYSAFMIITSVIIMSYVLGHAMSSVLVRIFNAIGTILYFVATCIMAQAWYLRPWAVMLLAQTVLNCCNTVLYGVDMVLNISKAIKEAEVV